MLLAYKKNVHSTCSRRSPSFKKFQKYILRAKTMRIIEWSQKNWTNLCTSTDFYNFSDCLIRWDNIKLMHQLNLAKGTPIIKFCFVVGCVVVLLVIWWHITLCTKKKQIKKKQMKTIRILKKKKINFNKRNVNKYIL